MKNFKIIIVFIVVLIISCGISVYATSTYLASDISYNSTNVASALNDLYSVAQIGVGNHYSTEEQIIGTWINGKKLYQKTINCGAVANGSYVDLSLDNIDTLVDYKVMAQNSTDYLNVNGSYKDPWCNIWFTYNKASSHMNVGYNNFTPTNFIMTYQYTKTTDTTSNIN